VTRDLYKSSCDNSRTDSWGFFNASHGTSKYQFISKFSISVMYCLRLQNEYLLSELAAKHLPTLVEKYKANVGPLNSSMTLMNVISYTYVLNSCQSF
jgi:hypothetical protein